MKLETKRGQMATVEEWQADFDIPEDQAINAKDDEEDWDIDMELGKTGKADVVIRRAVQVDESESDDDDEGVSTIKVAIPKQLAERPSSPDDLEEDFALPSNLTTLSLAPLSLNHRSSKSSMEWGTDKDHTSSSQSSDAYSSLGFADASPSSNCTSSVPESETDDDDDEADLEGLVIPTDVSARHLTKVLEVKKTAAPQLNQVKIASPDPEDDFELGLVIDDDVDLSPSRLLHSAQQQSRRVLNRTNTLPSQRLLVSSRPRPERAKSPVNPPTASARQLQKLRLSPSPPLTHAQSFQPLSSPSSSSPSFLSPKPASLRGQKSHTGLKPATEVRRLPRKASLSSLMEASQAQASGSGLSDKPTKARYEEPTVASRAKSHKASLGRLDYRVPPTRPSTPSTNPAALRLTMPTQSRLKLRPTLSSVAWNPPLTPSVPSPIARTSSPLPPRPPSSASLNARRTPAPSARVLKRPKRPRLYGDGTELDGIDDLPTDRDKESRFRVQPKSYGNRIPGGSYSLKLSGDRGTVRRKNKRDPSSGIGRFLRLRQRIIGDIAFTGSVVPPTESAKKPSKKRKNTSTSGYTGRKPTLIRNLSGVGTAKGLFACLL